jgi:hypothetical protein
MLFASIKYHATIAVVEEVSTNGATCDFELIAKDGVYLPEIPRAIPAILLWPCSRTDVAISCRCETCPCVAVLGHVDPANAGRRTQEWGATQQDETNVGDHELDFMLLNIFESTETEVLELPATVLDRPCYRD